MKRDRDLEVFIRNGLATGPSLRPGAVDEVLTRVPLTPQQRGWLPRIRYRGYQTMFSAMKVAVTTAVMALVGGLLLLVSVGGPSEEPVPPAAVSPSPSAAATELPEPPVSVAGRTVCGNQMGGVTVERDGAESHRGFRQICTYLMDDPRVTGEFMVTLNSQCHSRSAEGFPGEQCLLWGELEGRDVDWECTGQGADDPTESDWAVMWTTCVGTGENEGLGYAFWSMLSLSDGDFGDGVTVKGIIYEGPRLGEAWRIPPAD